MSKDKNLLAILLAILAAALYAISTPVSKVMLQTVAPTMVAAFLYFGAGIGMGAMMLVRSGRHRTTEERLHRGDIPYAVAMIVLDIAAPILMMYGLKTCSASNTSLLNNFEIVATALIALLFFGENVKRKLWIAIMLVTLASILLSLEDGNMSEASTFSRGSLYALRGMTQPLGVAAYKTKELIENLKSSLTSIDDLEKTLNELNQNGKKSD